MLNYIKAAETSEYTLFTYGRQHGTSVGKHGIETFWDKHNKIIKGNK